MKNTRYQKYFKEYLCCTKLKGVFDSQDVRSAGFDTAALCDVLSQLHELHPVTQMSKIRPRRRIAFLFTFYDFGSDTHATRHRPEEPNLLG